MYPHDNLEVSLSGGDITQAGGTHRVGRQTLEDAGDNMVSADASFFQSLNQAMAKSTPWSRTRKDGRHHGEATARLRARSCDSTPRGLVSPSRNNPRTLELGTR